MPLDRPPKSTGGPRRLLNAARYSMQGLRAAFRHEAAFRQELALCVVLVPLALWLPFSSLERVLLIGSLLGVLIVELLNSAIEALADLISTQAHPLAGRAKDLGSAAVMLSLAVALLTWVGLGAPLIVGRWIGG
ncbi:MAG: diacylglycerol kinase [Burkholderiaceae bacterium]